jgi:hypothetical protein
LRCCMSVCRLLVVSDISCDVGGSIEFLDRSTTIDRPFFNYDPITGKETSEDIEEKGITVMGVDILPTELPVESSTHFGNAVSEVLEDFIQAMTADGIDVKKLSPQLVSRYTRCAPLVLVFNPGKRRSHFCFFQIVSRLTLTLQRKKVNSRTTSSIWIHS